MAIASVLETLKSSLFNKIQINLGAESSCGVVDFT